MPTSWAQDTTHIRQHNGTMTSHSSMARPNETQRSLDVDLGIQITFVRKLRNPWSSVCKRHTRGRIRTSLHLLKIKVAEIPVQEDHRRNKKKNETKANQNKQQPPPKLYEVFPAWGNDEIGYQHGAHFIQTLFARMGTEAALFHFGIFLSCGCSARLTKTNTIFYQGLVQSRHLDLVHNTENQIEDQEMLFLLKYKAVNIWNLCRNVFKWIFVGCLNMDWFFVGFFYFFPNVLFLRASS